MMLVIPKAANLPDQVRLSHRMIHTARNLSGGENPRVVLARQLAREPSLLFAYKPAGTMDPVTNRDAKHSIFRAREEMDEPFIIVSHDIGFVRDICDRVALRRAAGSWRQGRRPGSSGSNRTIRGFLRE